MGLKRINNQSDLTTGTYGSIFRIGWSTPTGLGGLFKKNIHLSGFVYLTSVMDLYSKKIIGWHLSDSLSTEGVLVAIKKSKVSIITDKPVIIHSDRGCQFVSKAYINETPANQFVRSYSAKETPWDNACIESFHALIKREWLNRFIIKHVKQARDLVFEYIETFYNTTRLHGSCDMMSPFDYEAKHTG